MAPSASPASPGPPARSPRRRLHLRPRRHDLSRRGAPARRQALDRCADLARSQDPLSLQQPDQLAGGLCRQTDAPRHPGDARAGAQLRRHDDELAGGATIPTRPSSRSAKRRSSRRSRPPASERRTIQPRSISSLRATIVPSTTESCRLPSTRSARSARPGSSPPILTDFARCPEDRGEPDAAAVIGAIEGCTGVRCEQHTGKPDPFMLEAALERLGLTAANCIMVGDRLMTDIPDGDRRRHALRPWC